MNDLNAYSDEMFKLSSIADNAYRESRWIDAVRYYQRLTEQVPGDSYAWFRLGNTYSQQGAFDQAIHAYETSLENNKYQPKPWFNLSTAYLLNAQVAMQQAWQTLRTDDPARGMIEKRLRLLGELIHNRIEDGSMHANKYDSG
ncbi:MAG: tetratricopeptide repeat protein [Granulosicoccus sp.]